MPTPAEIPCSSTDPKTDSSTTDNDDGNVDVHQLELQFFTLLDGYNRNPPERVYWRDVVNIVLKKGLATAAVFIVGMRRVTPAIVHHVALTLYYYANAGGVIQTSHAQVAADCHMDRSTVTRAITVLKRLSLLRGFRTSRRAAETLAMNIGGLTWSAARQQARERRRMARAQNRELDFDASSGGPRPQLAPPSGGPRPQLAPPSGGPRPQPWAVRTGCTPPPPPRMRARPPATDKQKQYAEDLGIDHEGLDQVELGEEIEQAEAARTEHRAVAKSRSSSVNGRHQTALQARARREHRAFGAPGGPGPRIEQPPPADPIADAAARRQRGLENAAMMGYHPDPENPSMLIGPGGLRIPFHADSTTGPELPDDHTGGEE